MCDMLAGGWTVVSCTVPLIELASGELESIMVKDFQSIVPPLGSGVQTDGDLSVCTGVGGAQHDGASVTDDRILCSRSGLRLTKVCLPRNN